MVVVAIAVLLLLLLILLLLRRLLLLLRRLLLRLLLLRLLLLLLLRLRLILLLRLLFSFFSQLFSDGGKDRSVWLGSVHDISYLRGLRSLSCPGHCQPWDNWILYQSKSATFLLSLAPTN